MWSPLHTLQNTQSSPSFIFSRDPCIQLATLSCLEKALRTLLHLQVGIIFHTCASCVLTAIFVPRAANICASS